MYVNVLYSNYTNKHITFNKGEYIGHLEPPIKDMQQIPEHPELLTTQSITTERMMAEKVEPDTFRLPCHKLRKDIETKLAKLLKKYQSQFAHVELNYLRNTMELNFQEPSNLTHLLKHRENEVPQNRKPMEYTMPLPSGKTTFKELTS